MFRGYINRKQSYTLAVDAEWRRKSLVQFQAFLSGIVSRKVMNSSNNGKCQVQVGFVMIPPVFSEKDEMM